MDEGCLAKVQERIIASCRRVNRDPSSVHVLAVTKYADVNQTRQIFDAGFHHVGESRVQDALLKWEQLGERGTWHFIGSLQRRKVRDVVNRFTYLHSLDRYSLAEKIDQCVTKTPLRCFIQVNVSGEETKHGIPPAYLEEFVREVTQFPTIEVVGLMTMAPKATNPEEVRPVFRELKRLQKALQRHQGSKVVPHLSMGMSSDFEVAIEEGATWVRLGSVLMGR